MSESLLNLGQQISDKNQLSTVVFNSPQGWMFETGCATNRGEIGGTSRQKRPVSWGFQPEQEMDGKVFEGGIERDRMCRRQEEESLYEINDSCKINKILSDPV